MTTDPKNPLPPRLDPTCTCICHTQPGVMHVAPCCWETGPRDAEIARPTKERDAALAQVAALREVVQFHERLTVDPSTLSRRDAQMRAEGRKEGLREAAGITLSHRERWRCAGGFEGHATGAKLIRDAILAAADKGG